MPKPKTEAAEYKMITLRLPPHVLELLKRQQKEMKRTFNAHTLHVLEYGLGLEKQPPMPKDYAHTDAGVVV